MIETQYLVLIGTIWIAPHADRRYALAAGMLFGFFPAACRGLGWI